MTSLPFEVLFVFAVAAFLLALVACTAVVLVLAALLPRGSSTADWLRNLAGRVPRIAVMGIKAMYGLIFFGGVALFVILNLAYA